MKSVRHRLFSSPDKVINIFTDSIESSTRRNQASSSYTPMSPYKKSFNELFDEITPTDVTPYFYAVPVKMNGVRITEEDSAIFDPDVAKGLANGCLLPKDRQAYAHIYDQEKIFWICNTNMFRLLSSIDRANQVLKSATAGRNNVIRATLANRDLEIKRLRREIDF
ncbi:hypothetical protein MKX03_013434 [Papaver bracteatum]|nr:hypothetical protein MKX03_013434 [Papaver bracteatum]